MNLEMIDRLQLFSDAQILKGDLNYSDMNQCHNENINDLFDKILRGQLNKWIIIYKSI